MKRYERVALNAVDVANVGPGGEGGWWGLGVDDCIAALEAAAAAAAWFKPWTWLKYVLLGSVALLKFMKKQKLQEREKLFGPKP